MQNNMTDARRIYVAASAERKLGSRVTKRQVEAVAAVNAELPIETLTGFEAYATSGDPDSLSPELQADLKRIVEAAKTHLDTPSQKRRLWPRKVAAIISL